MHVMLNHCLVHINTSFPLGLNKDEEEGLKGQSDLLSFIEQQSSNWERIQLKNMENFGRMSFQILKINLRLSFSLPFLLLLLSLSLTHTHTDTWLSSHFTKNKQTKKLLPHSSYSGYCSRL